MNEIDRGTSTEFALVSIVGLAIFLPFLAIQYDVNGLVEALAVESGHLLHKNHLLYRPLGFIAYRGLQLIGYSGRSILVLQMINAVCGALSAGCAYVVYKRVAQDRIAAFTGALLLATSFTYWLFSTDAAYITLAALFASAGMLFLICGRPLGRWSVLAGLFVGLATLTWQASIFLVPALSVLCFGVRSEIPPKSRLQCSMIFALTASLVSGLTYIVIAFSMHGLMYPREFGAWLSSYGETGSLPMWGRWEAQRVATALGSAVRSIVPVPLAVPISELTWSVQRGRLAVDLALVGLLLLVCLSFLKLRSRALWFVVAYGCFIPFIVWWDPFDSKWFFIPNIFVFGFLACALEPWLRKRSASVVILACVLLIAATNFVTTIRPRHKDLGTDRRVAECVAGRMRPQDLMITAEWGWPDYLEYVHARTSLSLINNFASVNERIRQAQERGGNAYIADPNSYSDDHMIWLNSQAGVRREDLNRLTDTPAFLCYGKTIFTARMAK